MRILGATDFTDELQALWHRCFCSNDILMKFMFSGLKYPFLSLCGVSICILDFNIMNGILAK